MKRISKFTNYKLVVVRHQVNGSRLNASRETEACATKATGSMSPREYVGKVRTTAALNLT